MAIVSIHVPMLETSAPSQTETKFRCPKARSEGMRVRRGDTAPTF
jgi:hypothetical protein